MADDAPDCPLCMDLFELDDLHFYPCSCGYQICRFCWHRIRTDGNALCPACRKTYTEDPAMYRPLSQDEIQKIKKERKQKEAEHKQKISDNRQHLSNIRVIQKHLVFVVGLSNKMADPEILKRSEYFGKYGKIMKIVINPNTNYAGPQGPSASAYITYTKEEDALKAIQSINTMQPPLKIRASLGTTKYCTHFLRNMQCSKTDCMYLHDVGDKTASFTKEDMQAGKHQLFEKNLIDCYMESRQKRIPTRKRSITDGDGDDDEDDSVEECDEHRTVPEDWELDTGEYNSESLLPSQASWGSRDEKQLSGAEIKKTSTSECEQNQEEEFPDIASTNANASANIPIPSTVAVAKVRAREQPSSSLAGKSVESSLTSNNSSQDNRDLKTSFSTGWATSVDSVPEVPIVNNPPAPLVATNNNNNNNTASATVAEPPANNFAWPSNSDLGLFDLKISTADDDLGFDPFSESKSGLEDLIAIEKQQGIKAPTQPQPSFSWDAFWPSNYNSNQPPIQSVLNSYSLFGDAPQFQNQQMQQYRSPMMNQFGAQPPKPPPGVNPMAVPQSANPFRFPNQQQRFPSNMPPNSINPLQQQQFQNQLFNQFRFQAPPGQQLPQQQLPTQPSGGNTPVQPPTDSKNWQDGLRALLPNINISFANQQIQQQQQQQQAAAAKESWNLFNNTGGPQPSQIPPQNPPLQSPQNALPHSTSNPSFTQPPLPNQITQQALQLNSNTQQPQQIILPNQSSIAKEITCSPIVASPPPGFNFPGLPMPTELNQSWDATEIAGSRPPPPPGFSKPASDAIFVPPTQPTPGILNVSATALNNQASSLPATGSKRTLSTSSNHDDPSILWSKVLIDQPKEIETTPMAFPLPGETLNQASSLESNLVNSLPSNHMTSWNTIVSGNQSKSDNKQLPTNQQPLSIISKEAAESKPQKPSPIFGSQQKHGIKKPTAHVKPLKCHPIDGGFTTVQSSRQGLVVQAGSRVSELDDFSADFLSGSSSSSNHNNLTEYPPVAATNNTKSANGNKKRKKKKENVEHVSEIVVGRVEAINTERPPSIIEDERPKKQAKQPKKKILQKNSPPQQRKSPPTPTRFDHSKPKETPQQPIRILKSDGNTGTTMNSPLQASSSFDMTAETTSSVSTSNNPSVSHDHEIVSRLTESTEKLLKNVLFETEAIKLNTEQISKDLKSALEKCKESSLSLSDLEKINSLLTPVQLASGGLDELDLVDTTDLERQVESARREAKMLEARLNDVIRKNMASELETLKRTTKGNPLPPPTTSTQ